MAGHIWNAGSGDWSKGADWSGGVPNAATADATIAVAGTYTVTIAASQSFTVDSVTLENAGATLDIAGDLTLAGALAAFDLAAGTLDLSGVIAGGTLDLAAGAYLIDKGGKLAGALTAANDAYVDINGHRLTLSGDGADRSYVYGGGTLDIAGDYQIGGLFLDGGTALLVTGTAVQDSETKLDESGASLQSALSIAAHAVYDITADVNLDNGGTAAITDSGLFEKTLSDGASKIDAAFSETSSGTIDAASGTLQFNNGGKFAGLVEGGEIALGGGVVTLAAGAILDMATFVVADTSLVLGGNATYAGDFSFENDFDSAPLVLNGHTLALSGSALFTSDFGNNTFSGPGELLIAGTADLRTGYESQGAFFTGGAALDVTGVFQLEGGLVLGDGATDSATMTIAAGGAFELLDDNGIDAQGTTSIYNAGLFAKLAANGDSVIEGDFTNAGTGTLDVLHGVVQLNGGHDTLAGTIAGAGGLYLGDGGVFHLMSGLVLTIGTLDIKTTSYGDSALAMLGGNLAYAGTLELGARDFDTGGGGTIELNGHVLKLTGYAGLNGMISGPGRVSVTGAGDLGSASNSGGSAINDGAVVVIAGTMTMDGTELLGGSATDTAGLTIGSKAILDIVNDSGFNADGTVSIVNAGLFEKTADNGASAINPYFVNDAGASIVIAQGALMFGDLLNNGVVKIGIGALDVGGAMTGAGTVRLGRDAAASFEGAVAVGQTISFSGTGGYLALGDLAGFAGVVTGFAPGQTIDLLGLDVTGVSYSGSDLILTGVSAGNTVILGTLDLPGLTDPGALALVVDGSAGGTDLEFLAGGTQLPPPLAGYQWVAGSGAWENADSWSHGIATSPYTAAGVPTLNAYAYFDASLGTITVNYNGNDTIGLVIGEDPLATLAMAGGTLAALEGGYFDGVLTQASGAVIIDVGASLGFGNGGEIAGTLAGARVELDGGVYTLAASAVLDMTELDIGYREAAFATVLLESNRAFAGSIVAGPYYGGATIALNGFNFTLSGHDTLGALDLVGRGTLDITGITDIGGTIGGGAVLLDQSTITQDRNLQLGANGTDSVLVSIGAYGVYDILNDSEIAASGTVALVNKGLFEKTGDNATSNIFAAVTNTGSGTIDSVRGDLAFYGGGTLAGTLAGAAIDFDAGIFTLAAGVALKMADLYLARQQFQFSTTVLESNENFAGALICDGYGARAALDLNGFNLNIAGVAILQDVTLTGPGKLSLAGGGDVSNLELTGGAVLQDKGSLTQDGDISLGLNATDSSAISIAAGAVLNLLTDGIVYAVGTATVVNAGLFEKTADRGTSVVDAGFTNTTTGTIDALNGNIAFAGGGSFSGTLESAGAIIFEGGDAVLNKAAVVNVATLDVDAGTLVLAGMITTDDIALGDGATIDLTGNQIFGQEFDEAAGGVLNLAGAQLSLRGSGSVRGYVTAGGSLAGGLLIAGSYDVGGLYLASGITELVTGLVVQDGQAVLNDDGGAIATLLSIATGGTYEVESGGALYNDGAATVLNAGVLEMTAGSGYFDLNATAFENAATGTILVGAGAQLDLLGANDLNGTLAGPGEIYIDAAITTLEAGLSLGIGVLDATYGSTLLLAGNQSFGNTINAASTLDLAGYDFTLAGVGVVANFVLGGGTLDITGSIEIGGESLASGITEIIAGVVTQDASIVLNDAGGPATTLAIAAGALYRVTTANGAIEDDGLATLNNAGLFEFSDTPNGNVDIYPNVTNAATGTISMAAGDEIHLLGAANDLAGRIIGAGTLVLGDAGTTVLEAGLTLTIATLALDDATMVLEANRDYAGAFSLQDGASLYLNGNVFSVSGDGQFGFGYIEGSGALAIAGTSTISDFIYLTGGAVLSDTGTIIQSGGLQLGIRNGDTAFITIAAGALYDLTGDGGIDASGATGATISNAGLFEMTQNAGENEIQPAFGNTGTVLAASGTLLLDDPTNAAAGTLTGGVWQAARGTLAMVTGTALTTDAATIILSGTGAAFLSGASGDTALQASLATIAAGGTLEIIGGNRYVTKLKIRDKGGILVRGTLAAGGIAIAGGALEIGTAGKVTGNISFSGAGGALTLDSAIMPGNKIYGFAAGDTIALAGVTYAAGATVTVATAGVVTIADGGATYHLRIAGATVGETDFAFGPGSLLTRTSASKMTFLTPPAAALPVLPAYAGGAFMVPAASPAMAMPDLAGMVEIMRWPAHAALALHLALGKAW